MKLHLDIQAEVRARAASTYTRQDVQRALAALDRRTDQAAEEQREFLLGLKNKHGW